VGTTTFNRKDYVKLAAPMKLGEYAISPPYYPWLDPIRPFENWHLSQNLDWYDAYNAIKHDREAYFSEAKLIHAFKAVVGCAVLLIAQFGGMEAFRWRTEFGWFFVPHSIPKWDATQHYIEPVAGSSWITRAYPLP
jgi:hypothetical protein